MPLVTTTIQKIALAVFCFSLVTLFYTYFGYPIFIWLLAKIRRQANNNSANVLPTITVVISAFNEAKRLPHRIENLLASDYPADKLSVVVVSDGSTDNTAEILDGFADRVRLINHSVRQGKAHCLNVAVGEADSDIIMFADCRQRFAADTINRLAALFVNPEVGAASGELMIESSSSNTGGGVDAYWKLEKFVRYHEGKFDSCIGCTGAVYAIRRSLFEPLPVDTILDDVVIPMRIALRGSRVLFEPAAVAFDPQSLEPEREKVRKQRTLAGNFQMLMRYPGWLLPSRNRVWWQLISHKYLRLVAPLFLVLLLISNALLASVPFFRWVFFAHVSFYIAAIIGFAARSLRLAVFSIPAGFVFLNVMTFRGFLYYLRYSRQPGWDVVKK